MTNWLEDCNSKPLPSPVDCLVMFSRSMPNCMNLFFMFILFQPFHFVLEYIYPTWVRSLPTLVRQWLSNALETWMMWLCLLNVPTQNLLMLSLLLMLTLKRVLTIGWWQLTAWQQLAMFGNSLPTVSNVPCQNLGIACCSLLVFRW